jgi:hypothetical protein
VKEIVYPRSRWVGDERGQRSFTFRFQRIGDREILAGSESTTKFLLTSSRRHVDILRDKVDGRADIEVRIEGVKVPDKVGIGR